MAKIEGTHDVSDSKEMFGGKGSHLADEPLLTDGASSERLQPGHDEFTVDANMAADLGITQQIADGWSPAWIRDDRYWGKHVPGNRFFEARRNNPGLKMVNVDGEPFTNGNDLVLCLRPPATVEAAAARLAQEERTFYKQMEADKKEDDFPDDDEKRRKIAKSNSMKHEQTGMIGPHSRTEGMTLEEAYRIQFHRMSNSEIDAAIEREEIKWARGGRASVDRQEEPAPTRGGGTTYSLPQTVRPRNLAKA